MTAWLGHPKIELASCTSTNDEAAARARAGAGHGTVVVADTQTAGRGRQGRVWHSPPGENLYFSCVLRPAIDPAHAPPIALAAGVAVAEAVNSAGVAASIKWPNDVRVGGRKLAGILVEMHSSGHNIEHVVLGIGVNVNATAFPPDLSAIATSVAAELGHPVDRAALLDAILEELETWLDRFFAHGVAAIAGEWTARGELAGRRVRATAEDGPVEGEPVGLAPDGALHVVDDGGRVHRVVAGDVIPV